jgi:glucose/arabinose dehydrogenase
VEITADGTPRFAVRNAQGEFIIDVEVGSVPFGEWFHYAASYDQATNHVALYINGQAVFTGPAALNQPIGGNWDTGARIGARIDSETSGARPLTGRIDEFYIYHRALSEEEISVLASPPATPTGQPLIAGDLTIYYSFDDGIASGADQRGGPRILDGDGIAGASLDIGAVERVNDFNPDDPIPERIQPGSITVRTEQVASGLISPSLLVNAGDGSGRLFVSDQIGLVHLIENGQLQAEPFLDITEMVRDTLNGNDERGLSGFTFHPGFADPLSPGYGKFYTWADELLDLAAPVDFTHYPLAPGQTRAAQSVLREWTMDRISDNVFSGTSRELLRVDQPHQAHSAGGAEFGPDGYLYLSLGDGGTHDDQGPGHNPETGNAQDPTNIYGSVLRIDPMGNNSANGKYGIPEDNPFVGDPEALDEILFYGLRNPFRFSFERARDGSKTPRLIIGDTGQDDIEEVDLADTVEQAGGNFGWNMKEGTFIFDPGPPPDPSPELRIGVTADSPGSPLGLIDPIVQYDHGSNGEGSAVLGGFVYQGTQIPQLRGKYVFGDFHYAAPGVNGPNGRVFYADLNAAVPQIMELQLEGELLSDGTGLAIFVKGFGVDEQGELYVVGSTTLASADLSGVVLRLLPTSPPVAGDLDIDGDADMDDLDDFVLALRSVEAYEALYGVPPSTYGDMDGDGDCDFDDIPEFVRVIEEAGAQE